MTDAPTSKMPLIFILITILIDTIGFGIIIPVVPELMLVSASVVWFAWTLRVSPSATG